MGTEKGCPGKSEHLLVVAIDDFGLRLDVELGLREYVLLGGLEGSLLDFMTTFECCLGTFGGRGRGVRVGIGLGVSVGLGLRDSVFQ